MVESTQRLDGVFSSLADPTRRDILQRLLRSELSVGEIAEGYDVSLAAVSKHLKVLEAAELVRKRRIGKQLVVTIAPAALKDADSYLERYKRLWEGRLDRLERYLAEGKQHGR